MMTRLLLPSQVTILLLAAYAFWNGPAQAPAFKVTAHGSVSRAENDIPRNAAFEAKAYHLAASWRLIRQSELRSDEAHINDARMAGFHARASLARSPGDAYGWLALAWSADLAGDSDEARMALEKSWRWAPISGNLAFPRAVLASRHWPDLSPDLRVHALTDMRYARAAAKAEYHDLLQQDARFTVLDRLSRALAARQGSAQR